MQVRNAVLWSVSQATLLDGPTNTYIHLRVNTQQSLRALESPPFTQKIADLFEKLTRKRDVSSSIE